MKPFLSILLVSYLAISCQSNPAEKRRTIGVTVMALSNPYFKAMSDAIEEEAARFGFDVIVASGDYDPAKQRNQVNDFIVQDVDAIILAPVDSKSLGVAVRKCNEMGIPIFTADLGTSDSLARVISHIATDNYQGGRQAGEAMIEAMAGQSGKVLILDYAGAESCIKRVAGFRDAIDEHNRSSQLSQLEVISVLPCTGQRDLGFKATSDAIQTHTDLAAIFAINDPCALGAVGALEKVNKLDQVVIIGFDGQPEGKAAVRDGKIYADPIQFPQRIGRRTVQSLVAYLHGENVDPVQLIPTELYRQQDGIHDPEITQFH